MKLPNYSWLVFLALAAANPSTAAEITGKVRDAGADNVTVVIDGEAMPAVGDTAEIYFKVPGVDEDISVASGTVASVEAKVVRIKIEKTTGTIEKDQLARIKSASSPTTAGASPSPASSSSPAASPSPTTPSITGDWISNLSGGGTLSLSFKADGTLLWVVAGAQNGSALGKYRIEPSTKPPSMELFDFDEGDLKGVTLRGIFELQNDGRLKLDFVEKQHEPLKEFSKNALVFSKATSPIVRPERKPAETRPQPTSPPPASPSPTRIEPSVTPAPSPSPIAEASAETSPSGGGSSIVGTWTGLERNGDTASYVFKADGTVSYGRFIKKGQKYNVRSKYRANYRTDCASVPCRIELFDFGPNDVVAKGKTLTGLFEVNDLSLKLDLSIGASEHPEKGLTKGAITLIREKSDTPSSAPTPTAATSPAPTRSDAATGPTPRPTTHARLHFVYAFEPSEPKLELLSLEGPGIVLDYVDGEGRITADKGAGAAMFDKLPPRKFTAEWLMSAKEGDALCGLTLLPVDFKSGAPMPGRFLNVLFSPATNEILFEARNDSQRVDKREPLPPGTLKLDHYQVFVLEVDDAHVTAFVDKKFVGRFPHAGLFEGRLGFSVAAKDHSVVAFDNLRVVPLGDPEPNK
jgi:hypothetical protein